MTVMSRFHPVVRDWFLGTFGRPTELQEHAWERIATGAHVLVTAPTGSGKTLAAFLWAVQNLLTGAWTGGAVRVLYVSPLKALNNDIHRNLRTPLSQLAGAFRRAAAAPAAEVRVAVRSGDTPSSERRRMLRRPPEILITTPESLNILLTSRNGRALFTELQLVILDEVHAVAGNKRGAHLMSAVERLCLLAGELQRVALSATVNPPELAARFVGGYRRKPGFAPADAREEAYEPRPVEVVGSAVKKRYELDLLYTGGNGEQAEEQAETIWHALAAKLHREILAHRSTLIFTPSRRLAERIARLINELHDRPEPLAYSHHGSLSRELRRAVEAKLKQGELRALVATSSLELGIDIGVLDRVLLIGVPSLFSSALQRIGRSGHQVGAVSRGTLIPLSERELVDAAVLVEAVVAGDTEPLRPVEAPLDVLAQILLSMASGERLREDELYAALRCCFSYYTLTRSAFGSVLEMLAGRFAETPVRELQPRLYRDRISGTVTAKEGTAFVLYSSGGTIVDRGYFDLRVAGGGAKIGELDEEFVWERSVGDTFVFGSRSWRIESISHNNVLVDPIDGRTGMTPFWRAESQDRDFYCSERIGVFLERLAGADGRGGRRPASPSPAELEAAARRLARSGDARRLAELLERQRSETGVLWPHRRHLVVEHCRDLFDQSGNRQIILHCLWGNRVNRPFAFALAAAWRRRFGLRLEFVSADDCIMLTVPEEVSAAELLALVGSGNLEQLLREELEGSGYFGARFREAAARALLLPKRGFGVRQPLWLARLRSKRLLEAVKRLADFPIVLEAWRTCLRDEFELEALRMLLDELASGEIEVSEVQTERISPFARHLEWQRTNEYMYADDTPLDAASGSYSSDPVRQVLHSSALRPRIPVELIAALQEKLQGLAEGYEPQSPEEFLELVQNRLLIPEREFALLEEAVERRLGPRGPR